MTIATIREREIRTITLPAVREAFEVKPKPTVDRGSLAEVDFLSPKVEIETRDGVSIRLERARELGEVTNPTLWRNVKEARRSYEVYGGDPRVPLEDNHDSRAIVYFTEAKYEILPGRRVSEAITMRMVPMAKRFGPPEAIEDFSFFVFQPNGTPEQIPMSEIFQRHNINLDNLALIARIGKIPPPHQIKNEHIAECFALINIMAATDARRLGINRFFCLLQPSLQDKTMVYDGKKLDFVPAEQQLGIEEEGKFCLDRWNPKTFYYFLNYANYFWPIEDIKNILQEQVNTDSNGCLAHFGLPPLEEFDWWKLSRLGTLLTAQGDIRINGQLTVGELRESIKQEVGDGVFLSLLKVDDWEQSARSLLEAASARQK